MFGLTLLTPTRTQMHSSARALAHAHPLPLCEDASSPSGSHCTNPRTRRRARPPVRPPAHEWLLAPTIPRRGTSARRQCLSLTGSGPGPHRIRFRRSPVQAQGRALLPAAAVGRGRARGALRRLRGPLSGGSATFSRAGLRRRKARLQDRPIARRAAAAPAATDESS